MTRSSDNPSGRAAPCGHATQPSVGLVILMLRVAAILVPLSPLLGAGIVPG